MNHTESCHLGHIIKTRTQRMPRYICRIRTKLNFHWKIGGSFGETRPHSQHTENLRYRIRRGFPKVSNDAKLVCSEEIVSQNWYFAHGRNSLGRQSVLRALEREKVWFANRPIMYLVRV